MSTVVFDIRSLDAAIADAARAMRTGEGSPEAHISFATPELLWDVFTADRWGLLKTLCGAGPLSIPEIARRIGRDVTAVQADVTALLEAGILDPAADGRIELPYDTIKVEFLLQAA